MAGGSRVRGRRQFPPPQPPPGHFTFWQLERSGQPSAVSEAVRQMARQAAGVGGWRARTAVRHLSEAGLRGDQQRQTELAGLGLPVGMSPGLLPAAAELLLAGSCGGEGAEKEQGAAPRGWPKLRARGSGANRHQGRASRILDPQASGPLRGCEWAADSRDLPAEAKTLTNSEEK